MKKCFGSYFHVWSPYYQAAQSNQRTKLFLYPQGDSLGNRLGYLKIYPPIKLKQLSVFFILYHINELIDFSKIYMASWHTLRSDTTFGS